MSDHDLVHHTRQYFNGRSATYDDAPGHHLVAHALLSGSSVHPGDRVLDVATGTGLLAFEAAERGGRVTGVDLSPGMLTAAQHKAASSPQLDLTFMEGDAQHLPFELDTFDHVCCASALVMLPDVPAVMQEWRRVLKAGGRVAFDLPDTTAFGCLGVIAQVASAAGVPLPITELNGEQLLHEAGFVLLESRQLLLEDTPLSLEDALAQWTPSLAHPVCWPIRHLPAHQQAALHEAYRELLIANAQQHTVRHRVQVNLHFGQKPGTAALDGPAGRL